MLAKLRQLLDGVHKWAPVALLAICVISMIPEQAACQSMAQASAYANGGATAGAYASSGQLFGLVAPVKRQRLQRPPPPVAAYFSPPPPPTPPKRQQYEQQLASLRRALERLEAAPESALTLGECARWASLRAGYLKLAGGSRRPARPREFSMEHKCGLLHGKRLGAVRAKIGPFREQLMSEQLGERLEVVSNLVSEYVELRQEMQRDALLAEQYEQTLANEPKLQLGAENLRSFVAYLLAKVGPLPEFSQQLPLAAQEAPEVTEVAEGDDIEQLDRLLKQLIDRDLELNDEELEQLVELTQILERVLADREAVDLQSGRFRYLSGTLDAARTVILRKLNQQELDERQQQQQHQQQQRKHQQQRKQQRHQPLAIGHEEPASLIPNWLYAEAEAGAGPPQPKRQPKQQQQQQQYDEAMAADSIPNWLFAEPESGPRPGQQVPASHFQPAPASQNWQRQQQPLQMTALAAAGSFQRPGGFATAAASASASARSRAFAGPRPVLNQRKFSDSK